MKSLFKLQSGRSKGHGVWLVVSGLKSISAFQSGNQQPTTQFVIMEVVMDETVSMASVRVGTMTQLPTSKYFPPASRAGADGLVFFGGRLTPDWLIDAYTHGIFPWPFTDATTVLAWWSPDPRAVLDFENLHVPQRLNRTLRSNRFQVTCDTDFAGVIRGCATAQDRPGNTWLGPEMIQAYERMFHLGVAHSIEVRREGRLVGGTYGLALGGLFSAESKFYLERDASKVALVHLVWHLQRRGYVLLDIQQLTSHTAGFGARAISRSEYLNRLALALRKPVTFGQNLETLS